eukprot:scaffold1008_cov174-Amphora_coffeaeformis.AAC.6
MMNPNTTRFLSRSSWTIITIFKSILGRRNITGAIILCVLSSPPALVSVRGRQSGRLVVRRALRDGERQDSSVAPPDGAVALVRPPHCPKEYGSSSNRAPAIRGGHPTWFGGGRILHASYKRDVDDDNNDGRNHHPCRVRAVRGSVSLWREAKEALEAP